MSPVWIIKKLVGRVGFEPTANELKVLMVKKGTGQI